MTTGSERRRRAHAKGFRCVVWFFVAMGVVQAGMWAVENRWPEIRDLEYRFKLARLEAQLEQNPDRPLFLLLGSSRTLTGLRPSEIQAPEQADADDPLIFNFGMTGAGPVTQLMYLERLLERGIRPATVFIEVHPALLHQDETYREEMWLAVDRLRLRDIDRIKDYLIDPVDTKLKWLASCFRRPYLWTYLPKCETRDFWTLLDPQGWMMCGGPGMVVDDAERMEKTAKTKEEYALAMNNFKITSMADSALRRIIETCQNRNVEVAVYLMPEATDFYSWYRPEDRAAVDRYLTDLSRHYTFNIYDATHWANDDYFLDGHHLLPEPARLISQRFADQAFGPFWTESLARRRLESGVEVATRPDDTVR